MIRKILSHITISLGTERFLNWSMWPRGIIWHPDFHSYPLPSLAHQLLTQEEPQGFKKAAATQHITSSHRKVRNPEGEKRAHLFHRSFYKFEVKFPQSLLKRLPPTFQWSELYHISICKSTSSKGNGITMIFLDQLRFTSGARERFNLPQSTWSPNTKQKNGFR